MIKVLLILPCLIIMFQPLNAKVDPPNYNFSVETLMDFFPGKKVDELETKYGKSEIMSDRGGALTRKFNVAHIRYKFPVIIQSKEGAVTDFIARLPSYFLHDVFFQSLINKFGKQTSYKKVGEEAFYVWNVGELKHVYSAACTITCFPIFYAVQPAKPDFSTLLDQMKTKK